MSKSQAEPAPSITLHCLGGQEPPPEVIDDLRLLGGLPSRAREGLWSALGPCLVEDFRPGGGAAAIEQSLNELCRQSGASPSEVSRVMRGARFLLREAARLDIEQAHFERDLTEILGDDRASIDILLAGYEPAMAQLRAEILEGTLADHGKLLVDIDWRVDTLSTSSRGIKLRAPVVQLTLKYQEGERRERITLQVLPGALAELKRICEHILD